MPSNGRPKSGRIIVTNLIESYLSGISRLKQEPSPQMTHLEMVPVVILSCR